MTKKATARERFHDRMITMVLAAIWIVAALFVRKSDAEIPASMLLIGTVFFIMLMPRNEGTRKNHRQAGEGSARIQ